jgi:hypothetical protein
MALYDTTQNICLPIDIAISDDSNTNTKGTGKLIKYKDLGIGISRMCNLRTKLLPVITGALGTIMKGSDKKLQVLSGHPSTMDLQKVTLTL